MTKKQKRDLTIWISLGALALSLLSFIVSGYFSYKEYQYKRDPVFDIRGQGIEMQREALPNGEHITKYTKANFKVEVDARNNLENLYFISPDKTVTRIDTQKKGMIEQNIKEYFEETYANNQPDALTESGIATFYRFMVYTCHDGDIEINVLYCRGENLNAENNYKGEIIVDRLTKVDMLEFEQGHKDDSEYVGEKEIAQQYREIEAYLKSE